MRWRWFAVAVGAAGCGKVDPDGGATSTSSGATVGSSADPSTGSPSEPSTSGGVESGRVEFGHWEGSGGTVTGGSGGAPNGPCIDDDILLENVVVEVATNRILGDDVAAVFDPEQGSYACLQFDGEWLKLRALLGPFDLDEPRTRLHLHVADGARLYDLAEDPGPPATGDPGLLGFGNAYQVTVVTTYDFDTINQAGLGTVDVTALPIDGEATLEFTAEGEIAGPDGWQFELHFVGTVPLG
jgi:hypothetical protein